MKKYINTMYEIEWRQGNALHHELFYTEAMAKGFALHEVGPLYYDIYRVDKYKCENHDFFYRKWLDSNYDT